MIPTRLLPTLISLILLASPALAEPLPSQDEPVERALDPGVLVDSEQIMVKLPQTGCQLSVGNCTDNGTCEVTLGRCDGVCYVNLGSLCEGRCSVNVAGTCTTQCHINIASVCSGYCDVNIAGQCKTFVKLVASSSASLRLGDGFCYLSDPTSHCAEGGTCYVNVGGANCQYGSCFVNVAASCHHNCYVNVLSGCYGACFVNVYAICDNETCQVSVSVVCEMQARAFASSEVGAVLQPGCALEVGATCALGFGDPYWSHGNCLIVGTGPSALYFLCS